MPETPESSTELEGISVTANLIRKTGNTQHFFDPNEEICDKYGKNCRLRNTELIRYANEFGEYYNAIHIFAYGAVDEKTGKVLGLSIYKDGKKTTIKDAEQFEQFLSENFYMWRNRNGENCLLMSILEILFTDDVISHFDN